MVGGRRGNGDGGKEMGEWGGEGGGGGGGARREKREREMEGEGCEEKKGPEWDMERGEKRWTWGRETQHDVTGYAKHGKVCGCYGN